MPRGECRDCSKFGHTWVAIQHPARTYSPYERRCLRCGIRESYSGGWTRYGETREIWTRCLPRRYDSTTT